MIFIIFIGLYIGNLIYWVSDRVIKKDTVNIDILKECILRFKGGLIYKYILQAGIVFIFVFVFSRYGDGISCVKYLIMISFLILISIIDYKTKYIYSGISYTSIAVSIVFMFLQAFHHDFIYNYIAGGIFGFMIASIFILLSRGGMGWGDADILLLAGINLGLFLSIKVFFITFLLAGIFSLFRLIKGKKEQFAFTPFITIGVIMVLIVPF